MSTLHCRSVITWAQSRYSDSLTIAQLSPPHTKHQPLADNWKTC